MKKLLIALLMSYPVLGWGYTNTPFGLVSNLVARSSGNHSVFLNVALPTTENCTFSDRAIILDSNGKAMLAILFYAMANNKQVSMRINGCALVNPDEDQATTAPLVVKLNVAN